jgi:hypothetical protein
MRLVEHYEHKRGVNLERQRIEGDGKAPLAGGKETSPELAALASRYLSMDTVTWLSLRDYDSGAFARIGDDVQRLAASVLTQFEGGKP